MDLKIGDIFSTEGTGGKKPALWIYLYAERGGWLVTFYIGEMLRGKPKLCGVDEIHIGVIYPYYNIQILAKDTIKAQWKTDMSKKMIQIFFEEEFIY